MAPPTSGRLATLDVARFLGIVLMYYGHVVEQVMYRGSAAALQQYKFIYSFHMPLFFVLSGVIARDWGSELRAVDVLKTRLASRVVPLFAFSLILGLISLVTTPDFPPIPPIPLVALQAALAFPRVSRSTSSVSARGSLKK